MDNNYVQVLAQQGWQCPICKRVLAPFVPECPCGGQGMQTTITTTGTDKSYKIEPYRAPNYSGICSTSSCGEK